MVGLWFQLFRRLYGQIQNLVEQSKASVIGVAAQVTVGEAIADPAAASEPDLDLSTHPAPEPTGRCHRHSPCSYAQGPLDQCTLGGGLVPGLQIARGVRPRHDHVQFPGLPVDPSSVSLSQALPWAFARASFLLGHAAGCLLRRG